MGRVWAEVFQKQFLFCHEPPGGDEFLPGGATLFVFSLMVLMLFVWESM